MDLHSHFWILTRAFKPPTRAFKLSARNSQLALHHITCIIGFLINAVLLNVYFTLHRYYFFVKKLIFPNVYISVNKIFECLYLFFGWERGHQLSTYSTGGGWRVIQNVYSCEHLFPCFWHDSCLTASCFIFRNLTVPLLKKNVLIRIFLLNIWSENSICIPIYPGII